MAVPNLQSLTGAAAWGDLAGSTEPMLGNLFAVSIKLPKKLKLIYPVGGPTVSMLASGVTLPEESVMIEKVATKLSDYDVVVGKERGELGIKFREQVGAPVTALFDAWHRLVVDARNGGIGFPADYKTEIWIAALTGDGASYFWWGYKLAFPTSRGKVDFANDSKTPLEIDINFSYVEQMDIVDAASIPGQSALSTLGSLAQKLGI